MSDNPTSMRVPDAGVRSLFTLESRWQAWLDVEAALAKAEAELDVIPQDAAAVIVILHAATTNLNTARATASRATP